MRENIAPRKIRRPPDPNKLRLMEKSLSESRELTERIVRCPHCDFPIMTVMSDATGHFRAKCQNCKAEMAINLAYFKKIQGFGKYKVKRLPMDADITQN